MPAAFKHRPHFFFSKFRGASFSLRLFALNVVPLALWPVAVRLNLAASQTGPQFWEMSFKNPTHITGVPWGSFKKNFKKKLKTLFRPFVQWKVKSERTFYSFSQFVFFVWNRSMFAASSPFFFISVDSRLKRVTCWLYRTFYTGRDRSGRPSLFFGWGVFSVWY